MNYFLGIDGGGSKTCLLCTDTAGDAFGRRVGGPSNLASYSIDIVTESLKSLIVGFIEENKMKLNDCRGICLGSAGIDEESTKKIYLDIFVEIGFNCQIIMVNDSELVLESNIAESGIALISGTGSIAIGKNRQGDIRRVGGWGAILGDEGSGYWIAVEGIKSAIESYEKRGPETKIMELILNETGNEEMHDLISYVYEEGNPSKKKIAALSKVVDLAFDSDDLVAKEIYERAAWKLFELIASLNRILELGDSNFEVVVSGGILMNNQHIYTLLGNTLQEHYPTVRLSRVTSEPVWGAIRKLERQVIRERLL